MSAISIDWAGREVLHSVDGSNLAELHVTRHIYGMYAGRCERSAWAMDVDNQPEGAVPRSRCHEMLQIPEILMDILSCHIADVTTLKNAMLVNRQWALTASRILWKRVSFTAHANLAEWTGKFRSLKHQKAQRRASSDSAVSIFTNHEQKLEIANAAGPNCFSGARGNMSSFLNDPINEIEANLARRASSEAARDASNACCPVHHLPVNKRGRVLIDWREFEYKETSPAICCCVSHTDSKSAFSESPAQSLLDGEEQSAADGLHYSQYSSTDICDYALPSSRFCSEISIDSMYVFVRTLCIQKMRNVHDNDLVGVFQWLRHLVSVEFYICENIGDATIIDLATHCPRLTDLRVPGCPKVSDSSIVCLAGNCAEIAYLDFRACARITDVSIVAIANSCPRLYHLNVGRVSGNEFITDKCVEAIAARTAVTTFGLAGCYITNGSIAALAKHRGSHIERLSLNQCDRLTDASIAGLLNCPKLVVLEIKECDKIKNMQHIRRMKQRKVLVELCTELQDRFDAYMKAYQRQLSMRLKMHILRCNPQLGAKIKNNQRQNNDTRK